MGDAAFSRRSMHTDELPVPIETVRGFGYRFRSDPG
jgi:DNA-binding response OmpR family regulator